MKQFGDTWSWHLFWQVGSCADVTVSFVLVIQKPLLCFLLFFKIFGSFVCVSGEPGQSLFWTKSTLLLNILDYTCYAALCSRSAYFAWLLYFENLAIFIKNKQLTQFLMRQFIHPFIMWHQWFPRRGSSSCPLLRTLQNITYFLPMKILPRLLGWCNLCWEKSSVLFHTFVDSPRQIDCRAGNWGRCPSLELVGLRGVYQLPVLHSLLLLYWYQMRWNIVGRYWLCILNSHSILVWRLFVMGAEKSLWAQICE